MTMLMKELRLVRLAAYLTCSLMPWLACAATAPAEQDSQTRSESNDADTSGSTRLPQINVRGWWVSPYLVPDSSSATLTETPLVDIPRSIHVIPESVLRDQNAQSLADAIRNAPSISVNMGEGMRDEFLIRGVKTKSDFYANGLRDDTEYMRDLYNIAHVDVLLGPAALVFGRGGAGGVVNLVTKLPEPRHIGEASLEAGSWQHWRGTADIGDQVGESGAFRVLAMGEDSGGFRDHYFLHRYAVNPEFGYQFSANTHLDLGISYLSDRRIVDRGITSQNGRPVDVPRDTFFGAPDQNMSDGDVGAITANLSHDFDTNLKLVSSFRASDADRDYLNTYAGGAVDGNGEFKMKGYAHSHHRRSYINRTDLIADIDSGQVKQTLVFGSEYSSQRDHDYQTLPSEGSKNLPGRFPIANPEIAPIAFPYLDRDNHVVGKEFALYAQDQLSWGDRWKAVIGARWDRFTVDADYRNPEVTPDHTYNADNTWSPRAGLIFKPIQNDSIYASVTKTYTPQGANIALSRKSPDGANLDPESAINFEIGNKLELMNGQLLITAALFHLELDDVVAEAADGSGELVNTGAQRNRGFSVSADGALNDQWSIFANFTHLTAKITEATEEADSGARVGLVPRNQFSIWTRFAVSLHWGLAAGVHGESEKYTSYSNNVTLPQYVVGDLMAWYQTDKFRVQANLNNVSDKHYFPTASSDYEIMPGEPRNLMVSLGFNY